MSADAVTLSTETALADAPPRGWLARRVLAALAPLQHGELELTLPDGETCRFGAPAEDGLRAAAVVTDERFFRELAFGGSLGAAEAYLCGYWTCDSLVDLLRIFGRNLDGLGGGDRGPARWATWAASLTHRLARNTRLGSRRNIAAHYDLSNEFFQLFLDPTLFYSSALFESDDQSLEAASIAKADRLCRQLQLQPGDHLLEIGTGWGGFALHAVREYGCRVTTTTISKRQFELARRRFGEAGVEDRVTLLATDYRDLTGQYDHVVSIEMIEAVGHAYLSTYFQACDRLLKPGGRLAIQAITMPEQRYEAYRRSVDFIQKYVFPGGHLPSVAAMQQAVAQQTRLRLVDAVQFPDSYARTLRAWRRAFLGRLDDVRRLRFDERFTRLWDFYLCYCEAAFLERTVSVGQFVWERTRY
jgi:cyclopropane-fatty-acyl-phospholipid synthase